MIDGKRVIASYCPVEGDSVYHTWKQEKQDDGSWLVTVVCKSCSNERTYIADHEYTEGSYDAILYNIDNTVYNVKQHFCKCNIAEPMDLTIIGEAPLCPECEEDNVKTYLFAVLYPTTGELKGYKCPWCDYSKITGESGGGGGGSGGGNGGDSGEGDGEGTDNPDDPDDPDNPDGGSSGDGEGEDNQDPTDPDNPDNPDDPDDPDNPDNPTDPTDPDNPDNPDEGGDDDEGLTTETPPNNTPVTTVTSITQAAVRLPETFGEPPWHILLSRYDYNKEEWYVFKERWISLDYKTEVFFFGLSFFNEIAKEEYPIKICYIFDAEYERTYSDILLFEQPPIII